MRIITFSYCSAKASRRLQILLKLVLFHISYVDITQKPFYNSMSLCGRVVKIIQEFMGYICIINIHVHVIYTHK